MRLFFYVSVASILIVCVAGRAHHLIYHPEWTEAQAFLHLWPVWVAVVVVAVLAFTCTLIDDHTKGEDHGDQRQDHDHQG